MHSPIEIKGIVKTQANILRFNRGLFKQGRGALQLAGKLTAISIRQTYNRRGKGFRDVTGALRKSIVGGFLRAMPDELQGHVSAGDDRIGSEGIPTRAYVAYVEFGVNRPSTPFLRPGVQVNKRKILNIVRFAMDIKKGRSAGFFQTLPVSINLGIAENV